MRENLKSEMLLDREKTCGQWEKQLKSYIPVKILSKKFNYKGLVLLNIALICSAWEYSQHLSACDLSLSNIFI